MRVGYSSRRSEEIVKISNSAFQSDYHHHHHYNYYYSIIIIIMMMVMMMMMMMMIFIVVVVVAALPEPAGTMGSVLGLVRPTLFYCD